MEQRRHRALGALRAQLHARGCRRPGRPGQGRHDQRAVPGVPPVLVAPGARGPDRLAQGVHHPGPARQLRHRRGRPRLHAGPPPRRSPPSRCSTGLEYTDDAAELAEWLPLMMAGRDPRQVVAATRSDGGHRRQLRRPHPHALRRRRSTAGVAVHCNQRVQRPGPRHRRPLDRQRPGHRHRGAAHGPHPLRVRGRGRRRAAAAAAGRHPGDRRASAASRSAASSCAPARPSWSAGTRPRSTARPPSAPRRCRCRTWTCA